uniref:Uncharacterized protein n=1 Tax=viral metagenome TaxID=1070528 RepID=A0A6M3Y002_9ZZZZ
MAEVIIGTPRSRLEITPEGKFKGYYEVEFFIDDARYTVTLLAKEFTAEAAEAKVRARAAEIIALSGKVIKL